MAFRGAVLAHEHLCKVLTETEIPNLEGQVSVDVTDRRGWGSFGDVYMGQYDKMSVCVKILREIPFTNDRQWEKFLRRIKREVTVWRQVLHPNVVTLLGWTSQVVRDNLRVSLISTWCDGGNIKEYLRRNPMTDRHALIKDICRGLAYLHSRGIVHGDIKPANIVVGTDLARLCDFGLSSLLGDLSTYAQSTSTFGTVRFLSPELVTGEVEARNEGSDIWAFGCTSGEILCDERPYHWITNDWLLSSAMIKKPPYIWPDPDSFVNRIASCFEMDPERRPSSSELLKVLSTPSLSVDSAVASLKMLLNVIKLEHLPSGWRYKPKESIPELVPEFIKTISPSVQSLCREWCDIVRCSPCRDPEILDTFTQTIPVLLHWVAVMGIMGELNRALRGLYDLYNWAEDHSLKAHLNDIYHMTLQSREAIIACPLSLLGGCHPFVPDESLLRSIFHGIFIKSPRGRIYSSESSANKSWTALSIMSNACHPKFSSQGRHLAFTTSLGKSVFVQDLVTRITSELSRDGVKDIAFSPDGSYLAIAMSKNVCVWKWEGDGTDCVELEEDRLQKASLVAFSPDGRYLACCSVDSNICIWNVADWTTFCVFKSDIDGSKLYSIAFSPDGRYIALSTSRRGYIWRITPQPITCVIETDPTSVRGKVVIFSPDGHFVASVDGSSVHLWKASTLTKDFTFEHPYMVKAITFSPRGHHLASCSGNGTITIWDLTTRVVSSAFDGKGSWAGSFELEFSPDGHHLVVCADGGIQVWDVGNGTISVERLGHVFKDSSPGFSPDGRYLATTFRGMLHNSVLVQDLSIAMYPPMLAGHQEGVDHIVFSPNGSQLVSVSFNSAYVWNTQTWARDEIYCPLSPESLEFSNDGRLILMSGDIEQCYVDASTLKTVDQPTSWVPADVTTFPAPRFSVFLGDDERSLCLKKGDQTIHFCWFPDSFKAHSKVGQYDDDDDESDLLLGGRVRTPIAQYNDMVCIGGENGEVLAIDLAGFEVSDI